jgi:DNA-binding beta-propeller fold protein YncE
MGHLHELSGEAMNARAAAALTILAIALAASGCGDERPTKVSRNGNNLVVAPFQGSLTDVPERPIAVAAGEGGVWATSMAGGVLSKLDPSTGKTIGKPTTLDDAPYAVDAAFGKVWVAAFQNDKLIQVDPETRKVIKTTKIANRPFGLTHGFGSMWVTSIRNETVSRIDPATGEEVGDPIQLDGPPYQLAAGFDYIWVTNIRDGNVVKIDPKTNKIVGDPIPIGERSCKDIPAEDPLVNCGAPTAIIAAGKYLWVANLRGLALQKGQGTQTQINQKIPNGEVWRINPKTGDPVGDPIPVPIRPQALAGDDTAVWVVSLGANAVTRIDTSTGVRDKLPIDVSGQPTDASIGFGKVWFSLSSDDQIAALDNK